MYVAFGPYFGEPHLSPPWWAWVGNTNLLLWTLLCSCHGVEVGHLVNGNHFHSSALREEIITVLFSLFLFLPGPGEKYPMSHFICSYKLRVIDSLWWWGALQWEIHFPKASVLLNSLPMLGRRSCREFWFSQGNGSRHVPVRYTPYL